MITAYAITSVFLISFISLIGTFFLPVREKVLRNFLIYFVSFSAGALLGDVFIHLLPEVVKVKGLTLEISWYILLGILLTFVIEKIIHLRHHHDEGYNEKKHPLTFMTIVGDGVHNFIDGLVIGSSYLISIPVGIATTVTVILHEIPQEIGNFGVLIHGGYSRLKALQFNFLSALTAVLGTIISLSIGNSVEGAVQFLTAFAAGNFIYIAAADLIPELHKEASLKKSIIQFVTLILGIGFMSMLLLLEK